MVWIRLPHQLGVPKFVNIPAETIRELVLTCARGVPDWNTASCQQRLVLGEKFYPACQTGRLGEQEVALDKTLVFAKEVDNKQTCIACCGKLFQCSAAIGAGVGDEC